MLVFNRFSKVIPSKGKRTVSLAFKYEVTNKAFPPSGETVSIRKVAREYNVQPSQIRRWKLILTAINKKLDDDSYETSNNKAVHRLKSGNFTRCPGGGRSNSFSPSTIKELKLFYDNKRQLNESVGMIHLRNQAKKIDPDCAVLCDNALRMRIWRLFRKWNVSYRRATHKAQGTRHCVNVIRDFQKYVANKTIMMGCKSENVYNADQTNVYFSLESVYTYAETGSRTVSVKACDSNQRCTVMLCANKAGEKVIPYIVFKGKNTKFGLVKKEIHRRIGYPKDVELAVQDNAWFDEVVMLDWIDRVWKREVAVDPNEIYYLLLDSFTTHMTGPVRRAFEECNTEVDFIPPGYTSKLQMLDVGVNRPFKIGMRMQFDDWVCNSKAKKPTRIDVSTWIENAWGSITKATVVNSWNKAMVSSNLLEEHNEVDPLTIVIPQNVQDVPGEVHLF
jgi:hypothetical protein